jgi:hypothetical protein
LVVGSVDLYLNEIQTASHTPQLSLSLFLLGTVSLCIGRDTVAGRRGSRPWGKVLYGHTWLETPDPVRSPKLSNHRRVQYSGGGPPGKRTYCTALNTFFIFMNSLVLRRARREISRFSPLGQLPSPFSSQFPHLYSPPRRPVSTSS